jgi:hypothetical protein
MATIGQALTAPETGWRRYDNNAVNINLAGTWGLTSNANCYGSYYASSSNGSINLLFKGTKFRLISYGGGGYTSEVYVKIDSETSTVSRPTTGNTYQCLIFEKLGLPDDIHSVIITWKNDNPMIFDALDIDGYLVSPIALILGNPKTSLADMEIGDYIPCRYKTTTSNTVGEFSEFGTCTADDIPFTGSATPDGKFNFIKVASGLLIADRVIQHSITWDVLNSAGFIDGKLVADTINKNMTSDNTEGDVVTASAYSTGYYPWLAFRGVTASDGDYWLNDQAKPLPQWIQYEFDTPKCVDIYSIQGHLTTATRSPKAWIFQASNDGTTWYDLNVQTNVTWTAAEVKTFSVANSKEYKKYRINVTATNSGSNDMAIKTIRYYKSFMFIRSMTGGCGYYNAPLVTAVPKMTSNTAPFGRVFSSDAVGTETDAYTCFDQSSATSWYGTDATTPQYIGYEFPTPVVISGYMLETRTANVNDVPTAPRNWKFQGSNNGSDWVDLDERNNMSFTYSNHKRYFMFSNTTAYKMYRVYVTANNGYSSGLVTLGSIEFYESGLCFRDGISTLDKGLGVYPDSNEWDRYIVNSNLDLKITSGNDSIWNWSKVASWCKDTPINGTARNTDTTTATSGYRAARSLELTTNLSLTKFFFTASSTNGTYLGFRPVLQYVEPDGSTHQTNFWY